MEGRKMITLNTVTPTNYTTFGNSPKRYINTVNITDIAENYGYPVITPREFTKQEKKEILEQRRLLKKELRKPDASSWKYMMYMKHNTSEYLEYAADDKQIQELMKAVDEKSAALYPKTNSIKKSLVEINQTVPNAIKPRLSKLMKLIVKLGLI